MRRPSEEQDERMFDAAKCALKFSKKQEKNKVCLIWSVRSVHCAQAGRR